MRSCLTQTVLPDLRRFWPLKQQNSRLWHTAEIAADERMPAYTLEPKTARADGLPQIKRIIVKSGGEIVQQLPAGQPAAGRTAPSPDFGDRRCEL